MKIKRLLVSVFFFFWGAGAGAEGGFPGSDVKNLPVMQENLGSILGWKDALEEMATHSRAVRIWPMG